MRPVGFEPTPTWVKARDAAVTPRPQCWSGVSVFVAELMTSCGSCWFGFEIQVVVLGIELSAIRLSAAVFPKMLGATSPRLPSSSRAPRSRTETLLLPKQACFHLHLCPIVSSPCGSRTQPARLERPMTSPEVERAVLCAYAEREVGREALESSSAVLQTAARPSQLPAQVVVVEARKKARCRS